MLQEEIYVNKWRNLCYGRTRAVTRDELALHGGLSGNARSLYALSSTQLRGSSAPGVPSVTGSWTGLGGTCDITKARGATARTFGVPRREHEARAVTCRGSNGRCCSTGNGARCWQQRAFRDAVTVFLEDLREPRNCTLCGAGSGHIRLHPPVKWLHCGLASLQVTAVYSAGVPCWTGTLAAGA